MKNTNYRISHSNKKAQSWYIDYIVGFLIFFAGILLVFNFLPNSAENNNYERMILESEMLSDNLMSEGVPINWNYTNVSTPGILTKDIFDENKIKNLYKINYNDTRQFYNLKNDYYIYFEENNIVLNISNKTYYGEKPIEEEDIVHKRRILARNGSIIVLNVVVWK